MRNNTLSKSVALFVCLVILGVAASGLFAAPKRTTYAELRMTLMKHVYSVVSWLPYFEAYSYNQDRGQDTSIKANARNSNAVKPTGDIRVVRPGSGD